VWNTPADFGSFQLEIMEEKCEDKDGQKKVQKVQNWKARATSAAQIKT